jgi:hypothetical protein
LRQFAYHDPGTASERLWCYKRGSRPRSGRSPKSETRLAGYFSNPSDPKFEEIVETKLNDEIENPVHRFLPRLAEPSFEFSDEQREQMTRYVVSLFSRCQARQKATKVSQNIISKALLDFLNDDIAVATIAAHWGVTHYLETGQSMLIPPHLVKASVQRTFDEHQTEASRQGMFAQMVSNSIAYLDNAILEGCWELIRASGDEFFILSDTPVITWVRMGDGSRSFGFGFHQPNVEVYLPLAPSTCLQILPNVLRTAPLISPTTKEINEAQILFMHSSVYGDRESIEIDVAVQEKGGTQRIGETCFILPDQEKYSRMLVDQFLGISAFK